MRPLGKYIAVMVGLVVSAFLERMAHAAGSAPWDSQMLVAWQSIAGGPYAGLILGTGIIMLGASLMASEHGAIWRGMPALVIGGVLVAGAQTTIPTWFQFGAGLVIPGA